jgi:V/A-type H+-transporting ATPase subunit I
MKRVRILVPRDDLERVLERVGALGVLHLLDLSEREEWSWGVRPFDVAALRRECEAGLRELDAVARFFRPPPAPEAESDPLPSPEQVTASLEAWGAALESIRTERRELEAAIEELERTARSLAVLAPLGPALGALRQVELLSVACGWLPEGDLPRLEEALAHLPHRVVALDRRGQERLALAFVPVRNLEALERALASTGFLRLELPEDPEASGEEAARRVEERLAAKRTRLAEVESRCAEMRGALARPLQLARAALERALLLVEARAFAGRSEAVVFLAGWIPADRVGAVRSAVQDASAGRCWVGADDPDSIDSVRCGAEPVPILFRNPALVRPFEQLLAAYGAPAWREIDPTPLVAVGFWLMFGLMFGDVGHGAVLGGIGLFVFRRLLRYRDYGVILMECGLASALFGFAYGSVFGFEHALPALWFRPMEDVPRLLRVGAAFGIVVLGLSFALGVLNATLRRDLAAALFGAHGLLGALAYWIAAALGLRWLATGEIGLSLGLATALVAVPLSVLFARGVWAASRGGPGSGGGAVAALLGSAVELVDFVVRGVANTVSFVRLAAFAVSHAGLLLAVFALAETVAGARGGWIWSALVIVAGNLLILALEGLIVSIQGVRLVYYEFFSRFHAGGGLPYRPLRLRPGGLEEAT